MSQLSFVDVFDMARERAGGCCVTQDAQAGNGYFPSVHRLISAQYSRSRFISVFRSTGCHLRRWEVFSDFLALAACELDMARIRTPESMAHCRKICERYTTADIENMNEMFSLMVCALEAKFHDFLGASFMELELGDNFRGQYFTPYSVQCLMARLLKKRGEASDIRIDDLPLKLDSEIQNFAMHGTVSTGKSTLMRKILKQLRDRGDLVIIYDKGCTFVEDFYDESRDEVLNALDTRCPNWDLWEECRTISELENASTTLISASSGEDPFWQGSARTIFAAGAERMRKDPDRSYNKFLRTLLAIQLDQLRAFLAGTPASTLVDGKIEKTAISIRSVLTNYVKAMRYLQGIDRPGRDKFTIREWMKGQADKSKNGWLFITSDEQNHESLKPLISLWLSIAATSLLAMGPNRQRRVWFFYDELASLHKLATLPRIISEARKFGGCFALGFQNFAQMENIYGPKGAAEIFDLLNTKFFFRSPSAQIAKFVEEDIGETRRKKFSEQTSFGHEQVRDGISFGKEEERVSIVSYSDVQSLNDLQCFVTLPGSYPVVKLTMKYDSMPKVADALLLRDVQTSLDKNIEDELVRRTEEERLSLDGLFNPVKPVPEKASTVVTPPLPTQTVTASPVPLPAAAAVNTVSTVTTAAGSTEGGSASTGGTERDIEQDLPQDVPPGLNSDGEVVDFAAYEAWAQNSHQTRDMTRREEVNINHATDKTHEMDDGREY
ncbi:TPA: type IV conjugative transfer system coupling protein TraD [Salmonella enterica]